MWKEEKYSKLQFVAFYSWLWPIRSLLQFVATCWLVCPLLCVLCGSVLWKWDFCALQFVAFRYFLLQGSMHILQFVAISLAAICCSFGCPFAICCKLVTVHGERRKVKEKEFTTIAIYCNFMISDHPGRCHYDLVLEKPSYEFAVQTNDKRDLPI